MWTWYDSRVVSIEQQSPTTRLFRLELGGDEPFTFEAGQFVTMDLPISDKRLKRWRSYSIANAPNTEGSRTLEFSIVRAENSTGGSQYLFDEADIGTTIRFKGADGAFVLRTPIAEKDVVFICTGTGVAPFRSMIWDIFNRKIPHRNVHLIFGARHEHDILFRDEFAFFEKKLSGFRFDVALSREKNWSGTQGYVHAIYTEGYKTSRADVDFYLCGWSNMIDEAVENLMLKQGFDRSQIHFELYG